MSPTELAALLARLPSEEADAVLESLSEQVATSGADESESPEVLAAWLAGAPVVPPHDPGAPDPAEPTLAELTDAQVLDRIRECVVAQERAQWARSIAISELHGRWTRPHPDDLDDLIDDNPDAEQGKRLRQARRRWRSPLRPHAARLVGRDQASEADRLDADVLAEAFVVTEVALVNGTSERQAAEWLRIGAALTSGEFPLVAEAVREGRMNWAKARTIIDTLTGRHPQIVTLIEQTVVPEAALPDCRLRSIPALQARLRGLLLLLDPDTEDTSRHAEREDRRVYTRVISPVTGEVVAVLPLEQVAAIAARLDAAAAAARRARDPRTPDQVRADTLTELILQGVIPTQRPAADNSRDGTPDAVADAAAHPHPTDAQAAGPLPEPAPAPPAPAPPAEPVEPEPPASVVVNVVITLRALLGLRDDPAYLDRYGPIPAAMARDLAQHATFRCLITDGRHGTVLGLGTPTHQHSYRPGQRLQDLIRATWPVCSFPGCRVRAATDTGRCDLDHTTPWPEGATCSCNLSPLCRRHHQLKTHGRIVLDTSTDPADPPGTVHWRLPSGRTYAGRPEPMTVEFRPRTRIPDLPDPPIKNTYADPDEPPPF